MDPPREEAWQRLLVLERETCELAEILRIKRKEADTLRKSLSGQIALAV